MWLTAGPTRYKTYFTKKRELKVAEDHSVDARAPIELEFDQPPMTFQEQQRFNVLLSALQYLEWCRQWSASHVIVPGVLRLEQRKQIIQSIEGQSRSIEEIEAQEAAVKAALAQQQAQARENN